MSLLISGDLRLAKTFALDSDAQTYITAVESADGQALETATRYAINNFVIGCKQDGIWTAIKASCILAGARTLAGALMPLVGTAPANFNFVSGDYNRKTGLAGNGSTKYLNSNRNNNADPQNSRHLTAYITSSTSGISGTVAGALPASGSGRSDLEYSTGNFSVFASSINTSLAAGAGSGSSSFVGVSRSGASVIVGRNNATNYSGSVSSATPFSGNLFVFCRNLDGSPNRYASSRLAFYSIGESIDLALLDTRVTDLINAFGAAIP